MRKDTLATRRRIIDAAEQLFAEKGVEATSLLEIAKAAGQKNRGALQYHFENKEGLLDAVLDKHNETIAARRLEMLEALEQQGEYTLTELVEALVIPMAAQLDSVDGGQAFLRIHSQLMNSDAYRTLRQRRDASNPDAAKFNAMAAPFLKTRDAGQVQASFTLVGVLLIHGLAAYLGQAKQLDRDIYLKSLIQGIVYLLHPAAPEN